MIFKAQLKKSVIFRLCHTVYTTRNTKNKLIHFCICAHMFIVLSQEFQQ